MSRIAIFASYDKNGIIHDYVIEYLKYLKEIADKIIFIADNYADEQEQNKLKGLVDYVKFSTHGEYDFGSYKRGYYFAKNNGWLDNANELIFCNDSCFCISSLIPIFESMNKKTCDFWGMIKSHEIQDHLQSYFLVFKKDVFMHKKFIDWIGDITHQDDVENVIKNYELPLTSFLENIGFKSDAFYTATGKRNPTTTKPLVLLEQHIPLVKKKVFISREACEYSVRQLLISVYEKDKVSYNNICNYFKTDWSKLFPLILPCDVDKLKRIFYQKGISKSGRLYIKILKIPVYRSKIK